MTIHKTHLTAGDKYGIQVPEIIVMHAMGEYIAGKHAVPFLADIDLSAHSLIDSDGNNYRCREDNEVAYHAAGHNINSLGLETLVKGDFIYSTFLEAMKTEYVTDSQYTEILRQVREWLDLWPIKKIVRHSDLSPERKVDPGVGFPWKDFLNDVGMD